MLCTSQKGSGGCGHVRRRIQQLGGSARREPPSERDVIPLVSHVSYSRVARQSGNVRNPIVVEAAGIEPASESLRQRRLHAYPGCGGNPRPEAPFPASAPRRINPANRAVGPIPESHRRLGRTAGQARLVDVLSRPAGVVRKDVAYAASARSVLAFVVFPPFTGDGPPTCSRCFMYLRRTQYAPSSRESGGNSEAENRPRIPVGTVAPHSGPRRESATIVAACDEVARQPTGGGFPAGTALRWGGCW